MGNYKQFGYISSLKTGNGWWNISSLSSVCFPIVLKSDSSERTSSSRGHILVKNSQRTPGLSQHSIASSSLKEGISCFERKSLWEDKRDMNCIQEKRLRHPFMRTRKSATELSPLSWGKGLHEPTGQTHLHYQDRQSDLQSIDLLVLTWEKKQDVLDNKSWEPRQMFIEHKQNLDE